MDLPFEAAVSKYLAVEAPPELRAQVEAYGKDSVANPDYPYPEEMKRKDYDASMELLQIELVRLQRWVRETGARVVVIFEGQDAAGKGGAIKSFTENLNPRGARIVALAKPTETEAGEWYFQRYVGQLPTAGEIVLLDRSWYNRGVVEHVFGFCTPEERKLFFKQVVPFEELLVQDGIHLFKIWLSIGRATQLQRFVARERDPLKQWKLSSIDIDGLRKWDDYAAAIKETLERTHHKPAPWTVIRADDKRRARIDVIRNVLCNLPYARKDKKALGKVDSKISGGPGMLASSS